MMMGKVKPVSAGLALENVTVAYRNGHTALRQASFTVPKGTITALVGVNGAGKSTLFKAIMGFVSLTQGSVEILGMPAKEALRKNLVAYVPQAEEVDWNFPVLVEDVVMMGRYGHMNFLRIPSRRDKDMVTEALRRVNMEEYRKRQIGELSGGQRKRVFLARALAQEGQVILLDEPFTGVDVTTEEQIVELLKALRDEGRVMLVSTHNLGSVPDFCDRTVFVKGTVIAYGKTEDTFNEANLEKAFGGVLRHFILSGSELHNDADTRRVKVISDDERPFVIYGENGKEKSGSPQAEVKADASDAH
ncbi:manganese/iron ABC transporter ATP-binding protein [Rhizobium populisoli]|uniref:manganese/iron ABC transporter ATP-binding protein n=1 Tax=Rhizobium populisoli TaxID=2859785 RepID=UPI0035E42FE4